ncbi:MAG: hypothetical protein ABIA47_04470 [bacterium]
MAMELTHVRFARDISERLGIKDFDQYYAGTIYPDSRYITQTKRELTHGQGSPIDPYAEGQSDFEKGWAVHYLYDKLAKPHYLDMSPWPQDELGQGNRQWRFITAVKFAEDMISFDRLGTDIKLILNLTCDPVRGEDPELLKRYFEIQNELYSKKPTLDVYEKFWKDMNVDEEIVNGVMTLVDEVMNDEGMIKKVGLIYESVALITLKKKYENQN